MIIIVTHHVINQQSVWLLNGINATTVVIVTFAGAIVVVISCCCDLICVAAVRPNPCPLLISIVNTHPRSIRGRFLFNISLVEEITETSVMR